MFLKEKKADFERLTDKISNLLTSLVIKPNLLDENKFAWLSSLNHGHEKR